MPTLEHHDDRIRTWLRQQDHSTQIWFAARNALRAAPALSAELYGTEENLVMTGFRALLISASAAGCPPSELKALETASAKAAAAANIASAATLAGRTSATAAEDAVAVVAADSARSVKIYECARPGADAAGDCLGAAAGSAEHAIDSAASRNSGFIATSESGAAHAAAYAAADSDIRVIGSWPPLWDDVSMPEGLAEAWAKLDAFFEAAPETWGFWREWYTAILNGKPLPWDLSFRIATELSDEDWGKGPAHVAHLIKQIRFQTVTNVAPRLIRDEEQGVFRVESDPLPPEEIVQFACQRAQTALEAALMSVSDNIFNERSYETIVLRATLDGPKSISLLAVGFYDACLGLNSSLGTLYPADEIALVNLRNALAGVVDELCDLDEDARNRCARLAGYDPKTSLEAISDEELIALPDLVADEVNDEAREIIESDVERILSEQATASRWQRMRLANWMTTISIYWDKTKKGFKEAETLSKMVSKMIDAWRNLKGGGE